MAHATDSATIPANRLIRVKLPCTVVNPPVTRVLFVGPRFCRNPALRSIAYHIFVKGVGALTGARDVLYSPSI